MTFAGADTDQFPGLDITEELKNSSNLSWLGFYLGPAPEHSDTEWMEQRSDLVAQGWGLAPLYEGQQLSSKKLTATQGALDGANATVLMKQAGFSPGSYVFLDLENGPPWTAPQSEYVGAWIKAVKAGGFGPGVYCSHDLADNVARLAPEARLWCFRVLTTEKHEVAGPPYPTPVPASCGVASAYMWQREQNGWITFGPNSTRLLVDLSTSIFPDPSKP